MSSDTLRRNEWQHGGIDGLLPFPPASFITLLVSRPATDCFNYTAMDYMHIHPDHSRSSLPLKRDAIVHGAMVLWCAQ